MVKYKVSYVVRGEILVDLDNINTYNDVVDAFDDRVGFSTDELYDNLDHNFEVTDVTRTS